LGDLNLSGYLGAVGRAEAVWKDAKSRVALGCGVGILVDAASDFVGPVFAIWFVVAEEKLVDTFAITALELAIRTDGLIGGEVGTNDPRLGQLITVVHLSSPVTGLAVEVEDEAGWAADGGEGVAALEVILDAPDGVATVRLRRQTEVLLVRPVFAEFFNNFLKFFRLDSLVCTEVKGRGVVLS